jgi:hypothetical protein
VTYNPTLAWLLEGDPAIRWQVQRGLLGAPEPDYQPERARVATAGWGKDLLGRQDPTTGMWGGGAYGPKWISTHYTLQLLAQMGVPANDQVRRGLDLLLAGGVLADGGVNYSPRGKTAETCETGMLLAITSGFGMVEERVERMAGYLLQEQMSDGGWNCQRQRGATHASLHTTICVLEGLSAYRVAGGAQRDAVHEAELDGREFLAAHHLFRSHRSGEVVSQAMTRFAFPPWWHYDVLRGLDYLQSVKAERDGRYEDGIELLRSKRRSDGTWTRQNRHAGEEWLQMERTGQPSRWNTLRALRVLRWWEGD